jgi:micrococcal nuclease
VRSWVVVTVALLGAVAAVVACGGASQPPTKPGVGRIDRVVDGDTVIVKIDGASERVRLIGINTPESVKPNTPVQCFGKEASEFTGAMLPSGAEVRLERDAEARDNYGRLLAYLYRTTDGMFVNLELAKQGYADVLSIAPNTAHKDEFVAAVRDARNARRGMWRSCERTSATSG